MEVKTSSQAQTRKIAEEFAKNLTGGEVIALYGDLGSGKTTFVQGLAKGLGIKRRVISPTFLMIRSYPVKMSNKSWDFYHIDLFRFQKSADYDSLRLEEIVGPDSIVVIEWADKFLDRLPKERIDIFFGAIDEETRKIKIKRIR